ncbi:VOC family protein [Micromonospora sp. DT53]
MALIAQLSLGVSDAERARTFWAEALGYRRREPARP